MCVKLPVPAPPVLPSPFTLGVGVLTPPVGLNPSLCCKFPVLTIPAIPIGIALPAASLLPITAAITTVLAYLDQFSFSCPIE